MITENLIWFVDCRYYYQTTSLDKIIQLANIHQKRIKVIFDVSAQLKGRGYWHLFDDKEALSKELLVGVHKKQEQLIKFFDMNAIKVEIIINQATDYLKMLNHEVAKNSHSVVLVEDNAAAKRHSIFQKLTDINTSVLILSHKVWKHPVNLLAAVDPLHEHERLAKIDDNIALLTQNWSLLLKASWEIGHCCHIDGILAKYKNKVLSIHREELSVFAKKHRFSLQKCIVLEGVPELALASYIEKQRMDILVIGLVSRNKLEQFWVGSTTTALLNSPPCDMLLIKR